MQFADFHFPRCLLKIQAKIQVLRVLLTTTAVAPSQDFRPMGHPVDDLAEHKAGWITLKWVDAFMLGINMTWKCGFFKLVSSQRREEETSYSSSYLAVETHKSVCEIWTEVLVFMWLCRSMGKEEEYASSFKRSVCWILVMSIYNLLLCTLSFGGALTPVVECWWWDGSFIMSTKQWQHDNKCSCC